MISVHRECSPWPRMLSMAQTATHGLERWRCAMTVTAQPVPILNDNYAWLLREDGSGATAIVDPAEGPPTIAAIEAAGGRLDLILLTHHHGDHVAATDEVRARFAAKVVGAAADAHRLPKLDQAGKEGDEVRLGGALARVIDTPGHTRGQINYFFPDGEVLLAGDTPLDRESVV